MTDLAGAIAGMPPGNGIRTGKVLSLNPLVLDVGGGRVEDAGRLVDVAVGDIVAVMRQGQTWLALGRVKAATEATSNGPKLPITLTNGWTALAGASFEAPYCQKDALGFVHLGGHLLAGTVGAEIQISSALPAGYRSAKQRIWPAVGGPGYTLIRIDIRVDGTLRASNATAGQYVSLDGITYLAEA